jgi:CRISPR-associated protein Cas1
MLNYPYALLFTETRLALIKRGFDPMAGIIHAGNQYQDSFAYDVMETLRPQVDDRLL